MMCVSPASRFPPVLIRTSEPPGMRMNLSTTHGGGRNRGLFFFLFWIHLGQIRFVLAQRSRKRLDKCVSKNVKDRRHYRRFRIFEAPGKGRFGSEPILRLISNHSRQSADDALPDEINRIIGIMCRVENGHLVEYRLDIAVKAAAV